MLYTLSCWCYLGNKGINIVYGYMYTEVMQYQV